MSMKLKGCGVEGPANIKSTNDGLMLRPEAKDKVFDPLKALQKLQFKDSDIPPNSLASKHGMTKAQIQLMAPTLKQITTNLDQNLKPMKSRPTQVKSEQLKSIGNSDLDVKLPFAPHISRKQYISEFQRQQQKINV
jgi:hypothetical protein